MGDVHGAHKAMLQVFERSGFDYENDKLIFLGDVADGWPFVYECVEEFLKIKNLVAILGNHDEWFLEYLTKGFINDGNFLWLSQGGNETLESYNVKHTGIPESHDKFFRTMVKWHEEPDNKLFVHGGFNWRHSIREHDYTHAFTWDRSLWEMAVMNKNTDLRRLQDEYDEIFIGHTNTLRYSDTPMKACEVWNLDQGAGWSGKLSLMDIATYEFWQSDVVKNLYPNIQGRG